MRPGFLHALGVCLLGAALVTTSAMAPAKAAAEFPINTFTAGSQSLPSVTRLSDGSVVVVWTSYLQDGAENGIYGQRYRANGAALGAEFRVNKVTAFDEAIPDVAALAGGGFVVVWDSSAEGGGEYDVHGQRYAASGAKAGVAFRVNTFRTGSQSKSRVAGLADGGFVVVWHGDRGDGMERDVYGQRYDSDGVRARTEFRVNQVRERDQNAAAVAGLAGGGFVVVWQSYVQNGADAKTDVYGRRYNTNGVAVAAGEFRVHTETFGEQYQPRIAALTGGGFVVIWTHDPNSNSSPVEMIGRLFSASAAKIGTEFTVNSTFQGIKDLPDVAALSTGGFVVVWQVMNALNDPWQGVFGRRFSSAAEGMGGDFHVNQTTADYQTMPAVAELPNGQFFVVWDSYLQDGSESGVFGRRMR